MKSSGASPFLYARSISASSLHATHRYIAHGMVFNGTFRSIRFKSILSLPKTNDDGRRRLSHIWVPTGNSAVTADEDSHAKLIRAGFLRQAHSGVFHMLPLGRRVQDKLEALIDKYMYGLGASKLALSSISSEELWSRSGRLHSIGSELFRFQDRKDARYILSPTHEEEITSLVANTVTSYKDLPVRLYQISRKYRDELRPRHGLLRTREFVMKDLYTFDYAPSLALATYHQVRQAYARLFDELKLPYLVAEADSGDMGGNLSHEFHFPTSKGEDHVISCNTCNYVANEELAECALPYNTPAEIGSPTGNGTLIPLQTDIRIWHGITRDRNTLISAWYSPSLTQRSSSTDAPNMPEINLGAVKALVPDIDASIQDALSVWTDRTPGSPDHSETGSAEPRQRKLVNLIDCRLPAAIRENISSGKKEQPWSALLKDDLMNTGLETLVNDPTTHKPLNLLRIRTGDLCPRCPDGRLEVQRAIELGHTFHLGTRYTEPLNTNVAVPSHLLEPPYSEEHGGQNQQVPLQMGCHGIGVTRMIGAVAETLVDDKGLNWPRVMAPFEAVIVPGKDLEEAAFEVYDVLSRSAHGEHGGLDVILDDRGHSLPWKLKDADLVGYPVIVVVGRRWDTERVVEIQCRRLGIRQDLHITGALSFMNSLLLQL